MLNKIIREAVEKIYPGVTFSVEHPADEKMGDYSTNVALIVAKHVGKNPRDVAAEVVYVLKGDKKLTDVFDENRIEIAGPGFINFWMKDEYLARYLNELLNRGTGIGRSNWMTGKKVLVEYSSPNIAKRFSVGHLRSTIIGQAILNFYKYVGAEVTNDNHLGDWGTQFGMIIAAVEEEKADVLGMSIVDLEELYIRFNKRIEATSELKDVAREAFARLEKGEDNATTIWKQAVQVSLKEFEEIYKKLGVEFDHQYGESEYTKLMPEVIKECLDKRIAVDSEGAKIVEFANMPPAMLVKSNGTTTYFTRDLATIKKRLNDAELKADLYVYEVGAEQTLHLKQVFQTVEDLGWAKKEQFVHVAHGLLTLPEGKMSTRKGNTIKLEDLLFRAADEAKSIARERVDDEVSTKIGMAAVKFNELKRSPGMNYVFKWDEALAMDGMTGPYIQYGYVRTRGVLSKANKKNTEVLEKDFNEDEKKLTKWLIRFGEGEVTENCARNFSPQIMCNYLFELVQRFNGFYDRNKIVGEDKEVFRLALTTVTGNVIKEGLELLGIETVEKM